MIIFFPLLIICFLVLLVLFDNLADPAFCSFCHYLQCVPYISQFCKYQV